MITSKDFDRIIYKEPYRFKKSDKIGKIIGIDSEAYPDGKPFMICTSLNDVFFPYHMPGILFTSEYTGANFVVYNLKYDSGAFLTDLPREKMYELWHEGKVKHNEYVFKYIPHKLLRISKDKETVNFWDISQFYKMSLDKAARKYLGKSKKDISTKRFTHKYVQRFWNAIIKYCIQDAVLTQRLGQYLVDNLEKFGITVSSLYSCASVSYSYFSANTDIITTYDLYKKYKPLIAMACDAYQGGKFEVTGRGYYPQAYEYDIVSAYPYEIRNLVDITNCRVERTKKYQPDALYGFLDCKVDNSNALHLPCGVMPKNLRVYPGGRYEVVMTKNEYEYITQTLDIPVTIKDAWWIYVDRIQYPYRDIIDTLFKIKADYKGKDQMLYYVTKVIMNGYYGKMIQCIEQPGGEIHIGQGFNPVYGAVITANTRIAVTRMQNMFKEKCLAVHTDSVITTIPISDNLITAKLGGFEYVTSGDAIIIACGMYQIGGDIPDKELVFRIKGFKSDKKSMLNWKTILASNKYRCKTKLPYKQLRVESWLEAMAKNHEKTTINVFETVSKNIDLNGDQKRTWFSTFKAKDFLNKSEYSEPKVLL